MEGEEGGGRGGEGWRPGEEERSRGQHHHKGLKGQCVGLRVR